MSLPAFEIPDDPAQLPNWLEGHLVGLDLARLVAELAAVHGPALDTRIQIREVLGANLEPVLARGLMALPPAGMKQLLLRPHFLLQLQELVFTQGGPYWQQAGQTATALGPLMDRGRSHLDAFLAAQGNESQQRTTVRLGDGLQIRPTSPDPVPWYRRPWVVSLATAAAVLLGVFLYQLYGPAPDMPQTPAQAAWGWNRPDALPLNVSAAAYLNVLADGAQAWFNKRPQQPRDLAKRIGEFRQGCAVLIFARHSPLAPADRRWLRDKCRLWAAKLDQQLTALEGGQAPLKVRAQTDGTITKLIGALRTRAKELEELEAT